MPGEDAYRPHWATCPNAADHRRRMSAAARLAVALIGIAAVYSPVAARVAPDAQPTRRSRQPR